MENSDASQLAREPAIAECKKTWKVECVVNMLRRKSTHLSCLFGCVLCLPCPRESLYSQGFMEIRTPKIIPGESEGGAGVFTTDYFGRVSSRVLVFGLVHLTRDGLVVTTCSVRLEAYVSVVDLVHDIYFRVRYLYCTCFVLNARESERLVFCFLLHLSFIFRSSASLPGAVAAAV